jgi:hypothetical protein
MNDDFPRLAGILTKTLCIQKIEINPYEADHLKRVFPESLEFYETMKLCRSENSQKALTCILKSFPKTSCKSQIEEMFACHNYLKKRRMQGDAGTEGFCFKQDRNFSKCIEDVTFPLVQLKSGLPVRSRFLT